MRYIFGHDESGGVEAGGWLKRWLIPLVMILLVVTITVVLFIYRDNVAQLEEYGYLGAFLISLVANATIVLPMPGQLLIFALGASFNPLLVGLAGGFGGALGEMTGYVAGASGRGVLQNNRTYLNAVRWLKRWGVVVIFLFTATPLPVDLIGIAAGALRYPVWKFLLVCILGKVILYTGMAYMGAWGWDTVVSQHWDTGTMWTVAAAGVSVLVLLGLALFLESWTWRRGR
ncbi:MAG: VTT domain-containing protein [Dehalococcoidales bacterium]|nr:MAG: VTT domain-containing protein [Dehalococcoidales bacterium]